MFVKLDFIREDVGKLAENFFAHVIIVRRGHEVYQEIWEERKIVNPSQVNGFDDGDFPNKTLRDVLRGFDDSLRKFWAARKVGISQCFAYPFHLVYISPWIFRGQIRIEKFAGGIRREFGNMNRGEARRSFLPAWPSFDQHVSGVLEFLYGKGAEEARSQTVIVDFKQTPDSYIVEDGLFQFNRFGGIRHLFVRQSI
ncbi:MAG: hypothetical protein KJ052_03105 [Candidatus Hydrogenedentes bacterium]|nr:hypothetical protein [Candidatus Hydrogenedentota bacterium]